MHVYNVCRILQICQCRSGRHVRWLDDRTVPADTVTAFRRKLKSGKDDL